MKPSIYGTGTVHAATEAGQSNIMHIQGCEQGRYYQNILILYSFIYLAI